MPFLISLNLLLGGCYTYRPVLSSKSDAGINKSEISSPLVPGRSYKLKLKDGSDVIIQVTRVDKENIYGEQKMANQTTGTKNPERTVRIDNIANIKQWQFSPWATAIALGIPVILILGLSAMAAFTPVFR